MSKNNSSANIIINSMIHHSKLSLEGNDSKEGKRRGLQERSWLWWREVTGLSEHADSKLKEESESSTKFLRFGPASSSTFTTPESLLVSSLSLDTFIYTWGQNFTLISFHIRKERVNIHKGKG